MPPKVNVLAAPSVGAGAAGCWAWSITQCRGPFSWADCDPYSWFTMSSVRFDHCRSGQLLYPNVLYTVEITWSPVVTAGMTSQYRTSLSSCGAAAGEVASDDVPSGDATEPAD